MLIFFENLPSNYTFNCIDIYYYHNPSLGYGLPTVQFQDIDLSVAPLVYTNNSKLSQSDNDVMKISLIMLDQKISRAMLCLIFVFTEPYPLYKIQPALATQFFMSEIRFFADIGNVNACM